MDNRAPYKAKTLSGAQATVRRQRHTIARMERLVTKFDRQRRLLAKLSAKEPQFFNPLDVMEAERVRDEILGKDR